MRMMTIGRWDDMSVIYEPKGRAAEYGKLAANVYLRCENGCAYCWCPAVLRLTHDEFCVRPEPREGFLAQLDRDLLKLKQQGREGEQIFLSFVGDPYQDAEREHRMTLRAIQIIHRHGFGVKILTKRGVAATRGFCWLGVQDLFGVTLTFDNDADSRKWEPGADLPHERLGALKTAKLRGIPTWASCEPVIVPEQTLHLIRVTAPYVDTFMIGKWNYDPRADEINWQMFGAEAVALLERLGKKYVLKADWRKALMPC